MCRDFYDGNRHFFEENVFWDDGAFFIAFFDFLPSFQKTGGSKAIDETGLAGKKKFFSSDFPE
jgi:hypothetical protein